MEIALREATRELVRGNTCIRLQEQPFRVLQALLSRPGALITRDELRDRLWPDGTFVDFEHSLNAAVKRLRAALGDDPRAPRFIETLPRRGYRWINDAIPLDSRRDVNANIASRRGQRIEIVWT
jgi:DNA-binding winged helix-turn-helix (wHTH) protein